jgi:nucleoside phosphorylase
MEEIRPQLLTCFQEHVRQNYDNYCKRHHLDKSDQLFLNFLISNNIITATNLKRFTIQHEYERPSLQRQQKSKIVKSLAERFQIGERTVWMLLREAKVVNNNDKTAQYTLSHPKKSNFRAGEAGYSVFPAEVSANHTTNDVRSMEIIVLMLTPLQLEYNRVRRFLTEIEEPYYQGNAAYEVGRFVGKHHSYRVVLCQPGMYNTDMALATERAISQFKPQLAFLIGIAGGVKDVSIADVVIADKIYSYESGKEDGDGQFKARPEVGAMSEHLLARCQHLERQGNWKQRCLDGAHNAHIVIGPIAAGDKVVASSDNPTFQRIKTYLNDTKALEMEAYGFAQALAPHRQIHGLVIRGISDLCEGKAHTDQQNWQPVAADHAAAVAFTLLESLDATEFITYNTMDVKKLVQDIYQTLFPAALKEIGNDFADAGNNEIRALWQKVKPLFIEEVKALAAEPDEADAQAAVRNCLKRELEGKEELQRELAELLTNAQKGKLGGISQVFNNYGQIGVVGNTGIVQGDFNFSPK